MDNKPYVTTDGLIYVPPETESGVYAVDSGSGSVVTVESWAASTIGGYSALQDAGRQAYLAERRQRAEGHRAFNVWVRLSPIGKAAFRDHLDKYHRANDPNVPDIVDAEIVEDEEDGQ